jgi:hypothetical protein
MSLGFGDLPPEIRLEIQRYTTDSNSARFIFWDRASRALAEVIFDDWVRRYPVRRQMAERLQGRFGQNFVQCRYFMTEPNLIFGQTSDSLKLESSVKNGGTIYVPITGSGSCAVLTCINRGDFCYVDYWDSEGGKIPGEFVSVTVSYERPPGSQTNVWFIKPGESVRRRYKIPVAKLVEALVHWPKMCNGFHNYAIVNPY